MPEASASSLGARLAEWFWRGRALSRARGHRLSESQAVALQRATDLKEASETIGFAESTVVAQRLVLGAAVRQLETLWDGEGPLLERDEPSALLARRLSDVVTSGARRAFSADFTVRDSERAFAVVRELVHEARLNAEMVPSLRRQRWLRIAAPLAALALAVILIWVWPWWLRNKAYGAAWRASSSYHGWKESGRLALAPAETFFHTQLEDGPWLIVDLGRTVEFSRVRVVNRATMPDRAVPLELELSDDETHWVRIARRDETFDVWVAEVPGSRGRYLRFRVPRRTFLHLTAIQII